MDVMINAPMTRLTLKSLQKSNGQMYDNQAISKVNLEPIPLITTVSKYDQKGWLEDTFVCLLYVQPSDFAVYFRSDNMSFGISIMAYCKRGLSYDILMRLPYYTQQRQLKFHPL